MSYTKEPWKDLFWSLALKLNCLPSIFSDGNQHVFRVADELIKQRDELLAQLEKAASYHNSHECYAEAKRVYAYIAKVKGGE